MRFQNDDRKIAIPPYYGIAADTALVGSVNHNGGRGAVYRFDLNTGAQIQYIPAPAAASSNANFGVNIAITDNNERAFIGAWRDNPYGLNEAGSAFFFGTTP